jgi:hypothetical protein
LVALNSLRKQLFVAGSGHRAPELPAIHTVEEGQEAFHDLLGHDLGQTLRVVIEDKATGTWAGLLTAVKSCLETLATDRQRDPEVNTGVAEHVVTVNVAHDVHGRLMTSGEPSGEQVSVRAVQANGVLVGDHNVMQVVHHCAIPEPIVEVVQLRKVDDWGIIFSSWTESPDLVPGMSSGYTTEVRSGVSTLVEKSCGVIDADNTTVNIDVHHVVPHCRLSAVALMRDVGVRTALREFLRLDDGLTQAEDEETQSDNQQAALGRLSEAIGTAANYVEPHKLVPGLADQFHTSTPDVQHHRHEIVIRNATGAMIGSQGKLTEERKSVVTDVTVAPTCR